MEHQEARQRFANRLRSIRMEKGFTQEQLAESLGKTTEHISFLERAERSPSFELILDLARVLEVPASLLLDDQYTGASRSDTVQIEPITYPLPEPAHESTPVKAKQKSAFERLKAAFRGIREAQSLADEYGINDILQDNGGKVLQVLILLGLRISPGREGNDAVDDEGNEYELKTINRSLRKNAGITTHHHLNKDILTKYRSVKAWFIAIYEGVELKEIYKVLPADLEPLFTQWEEKIEIVGPLNNPKIPMRYVRKGERVYPSETEAIRQETFDLPE
ncbi:MAG: helix-turn-helix domain-containing protein [Chloroflexi bacterium AL-W]|nr:helix-turn-helix domain-containing protein [Chloroflexi bacterium AL-N1]NOK66667.1 helix-turn-helix domain-containing protein [Chloroflexi bacterium AL-N10]NOK72055.1 helix-turn-helix domain-containing protein [Chloroflexi bacterium AL-N5]NOK81312.1 helix-turn-helix domain-containing protein [Chloroflexi bacterium AL-W]NOK89585.1 helix-turn-helix domain-containing protein [Chloroflexi bacterium AL-N15]